MAKYIHRFNTQADFEAKYYDEDVYEVSAIGVAYPAFDELGNYTGENTIRYYSFVSAPNTKRPRPTNLYQWENNYYTEKRNPDLGDTVYNSLGVSEPSAYNSGSMTVDAIQTQKVHESEYIEPWVSYTENVGMTFNKQSSKEL